MEVRERFVTRSSSCPRCVPISTLGFLESRRSQPIPAAQTRVRSSRANALGTDLYLRIAGLYLNVSWLAAWKGVRSRAVFATRASTTRIIEFTMLELYWAYADKEAFISMIEEMLAW